MLCIDTDLWITLSMFIAAEGNLYYKIHVDHFLTLVGYRTSNNTRFIGTRDLENACSRFWWATWEIFTFLNVHLQILNFALFSDLMTVSFPEK